MLHTERMRFEWNKMRATPEGELAHKQSRDRHDMNSLEGAARPYARQAEQTLAGEMGVAAKDEISRFAKKILGTDGVDQLEELEKLVQALDIRKRAIFADIPDEKQEKMVFALALVRAYEKSLQ